MDNFRHAVLTCGYSRTIDTPATLHNAPRARQVARAVVCSWLGILLLSQVMAPAYARDESKSLQSLAKLYIHNTTQYDCFDYIVKAESHWNPQAANDHSTAYGIGQLLNERSKDAFEQVVHTVAYMTHRYGTICSAKAFWSRHWWY